MYTSGFVRRFCPFFFFFICVSQLTGTRVSLCTRSIVRDYVFQERVNVFEGRPRGLVPPPTRAHHPVDLLRAHCGLWKIYLKIIRRYVYIYIKFLLSFISLLTLFVNFTIYNLFNSTKFLWIHELMCKLNIINIILQFFIITN